MTKYLPSRFALLSLFLFTGLFFSCNNPPAETTPAKKKSTEHFPFDKAGLNEIKSLMDKYPQIEEFGYVFKDYEFLNDDLISFTKPKNVSFPILVNWIDYEQKKYVDKEYFAKYYKELIGKLKIDPKDFDQLRKKMTALYIEGIINTPEYKILFLNKPMGTYKGFMQTRKGRKGLSDGFFINNITLKVVEEFEDGWFGFVYP